MAQTGRLPPGSAVAPLFNSPDLYASSSSLNRNALGLRFCSVAPAQAELLHPPIAKHRAQTP